LAEKLEEAALADDYFKSRNLYPNIDYYSGFLFEALQIPHNMFCVIFAITRSLGWITHWREMMSEPVIRIGRPRQIYTGSRLRPFVKMEDRKDAPGFSITESVLEPSQLVMHHSKSFKHDDHHQ
jgi:citrate synthase